jgi:hypothetical protein
MPKELLAAGDIEVYAHPDSPLDRVCIAVQNADGFPSVIITLTKLEAHQVIEKLQTWITRSEE